MKRILLMALYITIAHSDFPNELIHVSREDTSRTSEFVISNISDDNDISSIVKNAILEHAELDINRMKESNMSKSFIDWHNELFEINDDKVILIRVDDK